MGKRGIKQMVVMSMLLCPLLQFSQHPDKKEIAEKNLIAANINKKPSYDPDSARDREKFKKLALKKVRLIETDIEELKARRTYADETVQQNYITKVLVFEKQKNELRTAVTRSGEIDKSKWPAFKKELNALIDSLGSAVKDLKFKSK